MNPTQEQVMSTVRWVLAIGGTALGVSGASWWANVSGLIIAVAPFVWGLLAHTQAATVLAAAAIPGVQVAATRAAPESVQKLANDPDVHDVVPIAVPLPSTSPPKDPPKDPYVTARRAS